CSTSHLPKLFPAYDAKSWFTGNAEFAKVSAIRNGTLQGGYLILAARALGLDCGPMSGFDNAGVDAAFFPGSEVKSNFLLNLGYGDPAGVHPRAPRFAFDDMAKIV
ncbi:MAG: malonic semialdehyde reductase, partial [Verrucomicrobiae bacterium]|nr:malonic semialdehyde reductase [Verrucomicrobiae bacterium]